MKRYSLIIFFISATILIAIFILSPNYRHYPIENFKDFALVTSHFFVSSLGLFCIILLLGLNRYLFAVSFPVFVFISSAIAYFTWQFDVSINSALLESAIYTNTGEVASYITSSLVIFLVLITSASILVIFVRFRFKWSKAQAIVALGLFMVCFSTFWYVNQLRYNTLMVRSPFSIYLALKEYRAEKREILKDRLMLGKDSYTESDSIIVVFVLGEALRADHIQMNGYHRNTMPNMEKRGAISFPNVYSPFTHTAQSLPYILTRASEANFDPQFSESSFIDIFKWSTFYTSWIGNQNPTKTYRFFVNECDTTYINKPQFSDYSNVKKMDSDLIDPFLKLVNSNRTKQLINLHLIGNHWWYNSNFPDTFAVFLPILENKTISPSNKERIINSYDNATLYTDYVLNIMIEALEQRNAILIFLSDHGQSFGEEGKWLHTNNTAAEKNPACFVWLSELYKEKFPEKHQALLANQNKEINTSFLFHSIIHGATIASPFLDLNQSLFSSQFQPEKESTCL